MDKQPDKMSSALDQSSVVALRVPTEIWKRIFQMVPKMDWHETTNLFICKSLYALALSTLYENVAINITRPGEDRPSGINHFLELSLQHLHLVKNLKIVYRQSRLEDVDGVQEGGDILGQRDSVSADQIGQNIITVLSQSPNLTSLSLDFAGLAKITNSSLLKIGQQITNLDDLRELEIWTLKFGWVSDLIITIREKSILPRLTLRTPMASEAHQSLAERLAGRAIMPVHSLVIGCPDDFNRSDVLLSPLALASQIQLGPHDPETEIMHIFQAFAATGLEKFAVSDPYKIWPFGHTHSGCEDYTRYDPSLSSDFLEQVIEHGSTLKVLEIEAVLYDSGRHPSPNFTSLVNLTSLRLVSCAWFFELEQSALPPALINFFAENYDGQLVPIMAALSNKHWLPKLETFDLTFHDEHPHIEYSASYWDGDGHDTHVWRDQDAFARRLAQARGHYIAEAGRPLSEFRTQAAALCAARNIGHQNERDFFDKWVPLYLKPFEPHSA